MYTHTHGSPMRCRLNKMKHTMQRDGGIANVAQKQIIDSCLCIHRVLCISAEPHKEWSISPNAVRNLVARSLTFAYAWSVVHIINVSVCWWLRCALLVGPFYSIWSYYFVSFFSTHISLHLPFTMWLCVPFMKICQECLSHNRTKTRIQAAIRLIF